MAISKIDKADIARYDLDLAHVKHDRSELYSTRPKYKTADEGHAGPGDYLYRAMSLREFNTFRHSTWFAKDDNGHQGWALYRDYSAGYLSSDDGITRLVEAWVPEFVNDMKQAGWVYGKVESGTHSWGIGGTQSNSFSKSGVKKADALDPWVLFHRRLMTVRLVDLLAVPV